MSLIAIDRFFKDNPGKFSRALQRNQAIKNVFICGFVDLNEHEFIDDLECPLERFIMSRVHNRHTLKEMERQRVLATQNEIKSCLNNLLK